MNQKNYKIIMSWRGGIMRKTKIMTFFVLISILFGSFLDSNSFAESRNQKIRVGWFDAPALHAEDEDGSKQGYDYDYLEAIRQYTNWEYEFVKGSFSDCYQWLADGKIDIVGIVNKNPEREKVFAFSDIPQGTEYCNLLTLNKNDKYPYQDYKSFDGMKIGIEDGTFQLSLLENFAKENGFTFKKKIFPVMSDAAKALEKGEIDAMLASNTDAVSAYMSKNGNYKKIAQFSPTSFYFAVTKGNTELLKELNRAMMDLYVYNPTFSNDLYFKYYGAYYSEELTFTDAEKEFIKSNPRVYIMYDKNWPPIEYYDKRNETFKGITPSTIALINEISGLDIVPLDFQNSVEVLKEFQAGKTKNSITVLTYDYSWANKNKVSVTQPFATTTIVNVTKDRKKVQKKVSLVKVDYITEMVKKHFPNLQPVYYDNVAQCLQAVIDGKVDCTYINGFQSEYYMSKPRYKELYYHTIDSFNQPLCIGVSENADKELFSILSKSLASISKENLNTILFRNSNKETELTLYYLIQMHPTKAIICAGIIFTILLIIGYKLTQKEIKNKNMLLLQYNRYNELMDMVGDIFFEYEYCKENIQFKNLPDYLDASKLANKNCKHKKNNTCIFYYLNQGKDTQVDMYVPCSDGEKRWFELDIKVIKDEDGKNRYAIGKLKNIDKDKKEKHQLMEKATKDLMTGLLNQASFKQMTMTVISKPGTFIIMDIDNFKYINDNFGHDVGDEVIKQVAQIIKESCRQYDVSGRIGGDEFGLFLLEITDQGQIEKICERINAKVSAIKLEDNFKKVTMSMGATITTGDQSYEDVFRFADQQLYSVKKNGKASHRIAKI